MAERPVVTAAVLVIGNEILSGRTQDANLAYLARRLNEIGVQLREARVVPDVEEDIVRAVNECRTRFDYVLTTGGIGPTHDDITAESVAKAFGVPLIRNAEAVARLERHYVPGMLNEARLRMANTPEGAALIDNPVSAAPGFQIGNVIVLAGVPSIMQAMFEGLKDRLIGGAPMLSRTVGAFVPEGTIAKDLGELQARFPDLEIGSYPFFRQGRFGASFVLRGPDRDAIDRAASDLRTIIARLGAEPLEDEPAER
jgi:molybdenum cofactor synthesis domain-containing protein